ncbi:hypothetical protein EYB25_007964 [Talaromyces marneffei]|nr:hypothetical protein EYB25_007964 [Talaromyces marneffei]
MGAEDASHPRWLSEEMDDDVSDDIDQEMDSIANMETFSQELDVLLFAIWMASHEVDQKYLGQLAATTRHENPFLSSMLYKILGLSVILSKKLVRARKLRRLDPTRETKSLQLYYHIVWLSREGLVIVEQYILPMVQDYILLKVLAYKLRASFYHIFVLFHNQPAIHTPGISSLPSSTNLPNGVRHTPSEEQSDPKRESISQTPPPSEGGPVRQPSESSVKRGPPGLNPYPPPKPAASFLLPALDYTQTATPCFSHAATLADTLLPGSHPLRLSVKLEYAAYLYDCLHDADACRRLAKQTIADVYNAQEGMDDESFEDAAELVAVLGRMVKRGAMTVKVPPKERRLDKRHTRLYDRQLQIIRRRLASSRLPLLQVGKNTLLPRLRK